jgi:chemotaxis protein MotB
MYRAYAVYDYFVNTKGFDPTSISSTGRGEYVPVASNSTAEGRAQNRRVEIKIYNMLNS